MDGTADRTDEERPGSGNENSKLCRLYNHEFAFNVFITPNGFDIYRPFIYHRQPKMWFHVNIVYILWRRQVALAWLGRCGCMSTRGVIRMRDGRLHFWCCVLFLRELLSWVIRHRSEMWRAVRCFATQLWVDHGPRLNLLNILLPFIYWSSDEMINRASSETHFLHTAALWHRQSASALWSGCELCLGVNATAIRPI